MKDGADPGDAPAFEHAPVLHAETQQLIREIEAHTGVHLVVYWNSYSGEVSYNDLRALRSVLGVTGRQKRLALMVKSDGGNGQIALQMASLLRHYAKSVDAYVPLGAESAATMLALCADLVHMGPLGSLSAIDTSISHDLAPKDKDDDPVRVRIEELDRAMRLWKAGEPAGTDSNPYSEMFRHVHPLVVGDADRAASLAKRLCNQILALHMKDAERRERISDLLNGRYPTHGYPIGLDEARRIGVNARAMDPQLEALLTRLNDVYSTMGQRRRVDFDHHRFRRSDIRTIIEVAGRQLYYRDAADGIYCTEARRWFYPNSQSNWRVVDSTADAMTDQECHFR